MKKFTVFSKDRKLNFMLMLTFSRLKAVASKKIHGMLKRVWLNNSFGWYLYDFVSVGIYGVRFLF